MPITEYQREQRAKHLGGSDIPVLFGLNRFKNVYDLWLEKTGKVEDVPLQSEAAMAGSLFENGVIEYAEQHIGKIKRNQYRKANGLPIGSNIDGIVIETDEPVEIKVEGLFWRLRDGWGEEGTDQVPYDVLMQAHVHMLSQEAECCHVAAFLGGLGFRLYKVIRDNEIIEAIVKRAVDFWGNNVLADVPPEDAVPSIEFLGRVKREPGKQVEINQDLVAVWLAAVESRKLAETAEETAKARMLAEFGDAESAICGMGQVSYLPQTRKGIDTKKLRAEHPEIVSKYQTETTFRVARFRAAKGEKS